VTKMGGNKNGREFELPTDEGGKTPTSFEFDFDRMREGFGEIKPDSAGMAGGRKIGRGPVPSRDIRRENG